MLHSNIPSIENNFLAPHAQLMDSSFKKLLGYSLINSTAELLAQDLFKAPFALLSHNNDPEPLLNYANLTALKLFELNWQQLIMLPSKYSAETINQLERKRLLDQVSVAGFINNYSGVRISSTGKRFLIQRAIVWNLNDSKGVYQGQAACFSNWDFLPEKV